MVRADDNHLPLFFIVTDSFHDMFRLDMESYLKNAAKVVRLSPRLVSSVLLRDRNHAYRDRARKLDHVQKD